MINDVSCKVDRNHFYGCTVHFDMYKVHKPTNVLFIKLDNVLKFTLKITLTCSYMFRSKTIVREPSLELSYSYIYVKIRCYMLCGGVVARCHTTA